MTVPVVELKAFELGFVSAYNRHQFVLVEEVVGDVRSEDYGASTC